MNQHEPLKRRFVPISKSGAYFSGLTTQEGRSQGFKESVVGIMENAEQSRDGEILTSLNPVIVVAWGFQDLSGVID